MHTKASNRLTYNSLKLGRTYKLATENRGNENICLIPDPCGTKEILKTVYNFKVISFIFFGFMSVKYSELTFPLGEGTRFSG